ncbi:MAG TPA: hypothetical protein VFL17_03455 [Anaerolineae bacterium]|nr:hypothetical protein [Anaerolineae bacterium]
MEIAFRPGDWPILMAYIKRDRVEVSVEIERNVTSIMLRNVSLSLVFLAMLQIAEFVQSGFLFQHIALCVVCIILSVMAGRISVTFQTWFYSGVFEAIAARSLQVSDLMTVKRASAPVKEGVEELIAPPNPRMQPVTVQC